LKITEPNFNMLFIGLIARLSSLMSKIGPTRVWGRAGEGLMYKIYLHTVGHSFEDT